MPSQSVAGRQNKWKRIKHKYHVRDAGKMARREAEKVQKMRLIAQRKGMSKKR